MCGIVGYIGKQNGVPISLEGLKRLEYRGYDSCGLGMISDGQLLFYKTKGRVNLLENYLKQHPLSSQVVIMHTRWATHGQPNEINAHPHFDCREEIAVVHNGIIENYASLKKWLIKRGHQFRSETDTEVIAHLIEEYYRKDLVSAVLKALNLVEGTYGLAIISSREPDKIIAARCGSPLILGLGKGEYFIASDPAAIVEKTRKIVYLGDKEIAVLTRKGYKIFNLNRKEIRKHTEKILWSLGQIEKSGYPHYMLKEIFEQSRTIEDAMRGRLILEQGTARFGGLRKYLEKLIQAKRIVFIACGTSYHAGLLGEYLFEDLAGIPTEIEYASEARYRNLIVEPGTVYFVISQSGETADTLEALRKIKKQGGIVFGICNVVGSTISREVEAGIFLHAGPEIGVASTKAFTGQVMVLILLALLLGRQRKKISLKEGREIAEAIKKLPEQVQEILKQNNLIKKIARKYYQLNNFLYLGRKYNFPVALEGALKLKEISYIHAEGYPAAEMKHGPIALIDPNFPVLVLANQTEDLIYQKTISNIEEVKARQARIIALATKGDKKIKELANEVFYIPANKDFLVPILNTIVLQLLAYHIAVLRGCDVDKPRNLAKSVTVE